MTRAKHSIVGVLQSSACVGAWAGGIYGLLVGSWCSWVFGAGTTPSAVTSPLQTFILGCLGGVVTGAATGAIVGALMGLGIYDFLKHEQDVREVDRLFVKRAERGTMRRRQVAIPPETDGFGVGRQQVERSLWSLERDR